MKGLARLGFTQSYTYFTWRNTAAELKQYFTELTGSDMVEYFRPNLFTNTPDILHAYLQRGGPPAFRVRLLLAATLSPVYGVYSGFELHENVPLHQGSEEYMDSEKYQLRPRDWDAPGNLNADLARLNRLRREEPALRRLDNLAFGTTDNPELLCYAKTAWGRDLVVVVNLDPHRAQAGHVRLPLERLDIAEEESFAVEDLLTGGREEWQAAEQPVRLDPARTPGRILRIIRPA
jgi:starch synthase (maltosyl-transferring)